MLFCDDVENQEHAFVALFNILHSILKFFHSRACPTANKLNVRFYSVISLENRVTVITVKLP